MAHAQWSQRGQDQAMQEGIGGADAHHAGDLCGIGLGGGTGCLELRFDLLGVAGQNHGQLQRKIATAVALEQALSQPFLNALQAAKDRGRIERQLFGGGGQGARAHDRQHDFEVRRAQLVMRRRKNSMHFRLFPLR
jgi:hypothetical protein